MRYPLDIQFKIDQKYGDKTDYGYHDGVDMNGLGGGNTDLGTLLKTVTRGIITSVHDHQTGWGKHLHLKFETPFGTRWAHYAHCQEILVREGQEVEEGIVLAKMGNTGTSTASHLHFSIKNKPTGVDAVAKTLEELKSWEDPLVFIDACNKAILDSNEIEGLKEMIKMRDNQIAEASLEIGALKVQVKENENRYNSFLDALWERLKPMNGGEKGEATILADIERLIGSEDRVRELQKEIDQTNEDTVSFVEDIARGIPCAPSPKEAILEALANLVKLKDVEQERILELSTKLEELKSKNNLNDYPLGDLVVEILRRILKIKFGR